MLKVYQILPKKLSIPAKNNNERRLFFFRYFHIVFGFKTSLSTTRQDRILEYKARLPKKTPDHNDVYYFHNG